MRIHSVEAIAVDIPLTKNFGGSTYAVAQALHRHHPDAHRRGPGQRGLQRRQPRARPRDRPPDPRGAGAAACAASASSRASASGSASSPSPTEPRQARRSWRPSPAWTRRSGTWSARRSARASARCSAATGGGCPSSRIGGYYMRGQDARRHRPRDGGAIAAPAWPAASSRSAGSRPRRTPSGSRRRAGRRGPISCSRSTPTAAGTVADAVRFARLVEPLDIRWFEEPCHWHDDARHDGARAAGDADPGHRGPERDHEPRRAPAARRGRGRPRQLRRLRGRRRHRVAPRRRALRAPPACRWRTTRSRRSRSTCSPRCPTAPTSSASPIPSATRSGRPCGPIARPITRRVDRGAGRPRLRPGARRGDGAAVPRRLTAPGPRGAASAASRSRTARRRLTAYAS